MIKILSDDEELPGKKKIALCPDKLCLLMKQVELQGKTFMEF